MPKRPARIDRADTLLTWHVQWLTADLLILHAAYCLFVNGLKEGRPQLFRHLVDHLASQVLRQIRWQLCTGYIHQTTDLRQHITTSQDHQQPEAT